MEDEGRKQIQFKGEHTLILYSTPLQQSEIDVQHVIITPSVSVLMGKTMEAS